MRRNLIALAAALCLAAGASAQDIAPSEKNTASHYLDDTRDGLLAAVKGLSDAQWKYKPAPDRWSIAEVAEHVAVLEELFVNQISPQLKLAPPGKPDMEIHKIDAMILSKVPDRSTKVHAPEILVPTGRWTPQESLQRFLDGRRETAAFLALGINLRAHVLNHPALGPLDAYQWVLAVAAHTERHTKQILEVKSDPHFPVN